MFLQNVFLNVGENMLLKAGGQTSVYRMTCIFKCCGSAQENSKDPLSFLLSYFFFLISTHLFYFLTMQIECID